MQKNSPLESLRRKHGMTQETLARRLDIGQSRLSQLEAGEPLPGRIQRKLIELFGNEAAPLCDTQTPSDAFRFLRKGWNAFDVVRVEMERIVNEISAASEQLRPYQEKLDQFLKQIGGAPGTPQAVTLRKHLDNLLGAAADSARKRRIPPPKEEHDTFKNGQDVLIPLSNETFNSLLPLIEATNGLSSKDLLLLTELAKRLAKSA